MVVSVSAAALEQQIVDGGLVVEGDRRDRGRHGEDDVEIGSRQQLGFAVLQPSSGGGGLTLGTMAVAAGIIGDARVRAVLAALDMTAERGGAAMFDRRHDLQLGETDMAGVGLAPVRTMGVKNVGDLKTRPRHQRASGLLGASDQVFQLFQRAGDVADRVDGDAGVERRRL